MRNFMTSLFTIIMMFAPAAILISLLMGAAASAQNSAQTATAKPAASPIDKQALQSAMESRFQMPVKITKVRSVPNDSPTPTVSDFRVNMLIGNKHKTTCNLRLFGEKSVAVMNQCASKTANVEADSLMSFAELDIDNSTARP